MKHLTLLTLAFFALNASASPATKLFTSSKTFADRMFCVSHQCFPEEMEAELTNKCYEKGYTTCETIVYKKIVTSSRGAGFFCGDTQKGRCIVTVKGSNKE